MDWIVEFLLTMGDRLAALFVARDAPNFDVVQGMLAVVALAGCVALAAYFLRQK
jgi:hypothetical protein